MNLTFQQAEAINTAVDKIHALFPLFSVMATIFLLQGFGKPQVAFTSPWQKYYAWFRFGFVLLLVSTVLSQGVLGGCLIHIPQNWFNRVYLNQDNAVPFGLFARQYIDPKYWPFLRMFYLLAGLLVSWRALVFYRKFVNLPTVYQHNKGNENKVSCLT
jgi:hypothetical protein